ncbi:hypothetical protein PYW08_011803 [Mythimna loreyi]|uniref:Uncharacterized protein n=1 Tax=Mythimna loreyi TaxID=667449 RepID=A0ACC2QKH2_9NEOP|nr:hypothetical protein PYW08_011803 [Mythimna loreyi]
METGSTNEAFHKFIDTFLLFYNLCFPTIRVKITNKALNKLNWLSKGIKISCKNKSKLHYKLKYKRNEPCRSQYKTYCNLLKKCIITSRKNNNTKYIIKAQNKCKAAWNIIKRHTGTDLKRSCISKINIDNNDCTSPGSIANHFNNFFIDTVTNNSQNNKGESTINQINHIESISNSIFLHPLDKSDLKKNSDVP